MTSPHEQLTNILKQVDCDTTDALIKMLQSRLEYALTIESTFFNNPNYSEKIESYEKSIAPKFKSLLDKQNNLKEHAKETLDHKQSNKSKSKRM